MKNRAIVISALGTAISLFVFAGTPRDARAQAAHGDHGSGRSSHRADCERPSYSEPKPAREAVVSSFTGFSVKASPATDPASVVAKINGNPVMVKVTKKPSGSYLIEGSPEDAIAAPGYVTVWVAAQGSERTCSSKVLYAYRVLVEPAKAEP